MPGAKNFIAPGIFLTKSLLHMSTLAKKMLESIGKHFLLKRPPNALYNMKDLT